MSKDVVRQITPDECERRRAKIVADVGKHVVRAFAAHPGLKSAVLMVGQFWADEALDAVHYALPFSVTETPDLAAYVRHAERVQEMLFDPKTDMDELDVNIVLLDMWIEGAAAEQQLGAKPWTDDQRHNFQRAYLYDVDWDSNGDAIPLFAAFCPEGADQEQPTGLSHAPYCIFRRDGGGVAVEVVGVKVRPWLEGVAPQGMD